MESSLNFHYSRRDKSTLKESYQPQRHRCDLESVGSRLRSLDRKYEDQTQISPFDSSGNSESNLQTVDKHTE